MSFGVVRLDKVNSVYDGHIHSVVYDADILENGMVGVVGDLLEGERELRKLEVPTGTDKPVVLIAHPEINYKEDRISDNALENFFIPKGKPARAYDLIRGDIFSVSKKMVTPLDETKGVEKGAMLSTANGSLLLTEVDASALTGEEAFLAKVIDKEVVGTATVVGQAGVISRVVEFIVVEVVRNRE